MDEQQEAPTASEVPVEGGDRQGKQEQKLTPQMVATMIADRLGETRIGPRVQIKRIVQVLGRSQARALLEETLRVEENGGIMLPDGSRRRTPGGVFFYLAHTKGQPKPGRAFPKKPTTPSTHTNKNASPHPVKPSDRLPATKSSPPATPFNWEERSAVIEQIGQAAGRVTTVKITLIGTMGTFVDKGACIVGVMAHTGEKLPALPKGVPVPQTITTKYVVYIGAKQWKNVAATVADPEDALIIEGFPQVDPKTDAISVFASNVTSKKLQAAKR
jgi:hypothetical protein